MSPARKILACLALPMLGILLSFLVIMIGGAPAAHAETGQKALILGSSVSGGATSAEATNAIGNGFTVNVVDDATWGAMTAAQFADYQLVIVGDPNCGTLSAVVSENAKPLADAVMARAGGNTKAGNRILIGTDPVLHSSQGGAKLVETGIDFAGVQDGATNLYLNFTCGDRDYDANGTPDGQEKLLPLLTLDPTPGWTQNERPPCGVSASLISNAAQFATLKSADLQGWGCSVHETFPTFPTDWTALAIATDTQTMPTCGTDVDNGARTCGEAYLLIAGSGIVVEAPNLSVTPPTATNTVGTSHTVTAAVTNTDGTPRGGVVVSFLVTGANAGATGTCVPAACTTNAAGKVTFTYRGAKAGDDTINAAVTLDGSGQRATASKRWVADTTPPPPPPNTTIVSGPPRLTRDRAPTFTFRSDQPGTTFECSLNGGPFAPCSSPFTLPGLSAGDYTLRVRARDAAGNVDPTPESFPFTVAARIADLPGPVLGKFVNAEPVSGKVFVSVPGGASSGRGARAAQKGRRYVPLREAKQIPVGSFFKTNRGRVRLQIATRTRRRGRQVGVFNGGLFQTAQSRRRRSRGLFVLRLKGSSFRRCRRAGHGRQAGVARHSRRKVRRLRGRARGRFRTRGRYSSATVRGTVWSVTDRCDGTLTKVARGRVAVRDFRRRRNVIVRAGKRYFARARR